MSHLDEGTLVAMRDGALVDGDAVEHLGACAVCEAGLEQTRERSAAIDRALGSLDDPVRLDRAKAAVRARLDAERDGVGRPKRRVGAHLGRAAAVLLVAAGAVYAVPGSPLRRALETDATDVTGAARGVEAATTTQEPATGGIEVDVPDGRIVVVLTGVAPGSSVEVRWRDAATARISAPAGSSFSFADGRAEARVTGGPVEVELPRYAPTVSVVVDGRTYLRRASGELELLQPTTERSADLVRFVVSER